MIGTIICKLRKHKGLTQKQISDELGITITYISVIENNKEYPSIKLMEKLSTLLEVPLPVMFFLSISEKDIPKEKLEVYRVVMPRVSNFILSLFDDNVKSIIH